MGGSNTAETPKGNWATEKKTPQALGDAPLHEKPQLLKPYKDLLTTGQQNISLGEMIAPYYGGEETLKSEIEAAKAYAANPTKTKTYPDIKLKMDYEKIGEKIPVASKESSISHFNPETKSAEVQNPTGALLETAKFLEMSKSEDPEQQKLFQKFLNKNVYTKKDIEKKFENPVSDFIGTLEHEVGHYPTISETEYNIGISGTHISDPTELSNQLGRIQREAFYLYGKRFTPEEFDDFMEQQKSVPDEERFQNFSPDTRRGLREILNSKELPSYPKSFRALWDIAKESIPEFVQAKPQSSYDAIENGLTNSEKQT